MLDITDVVLNEGRKGSYSVQTEMPSLSYRTGDFPVVERTPVKLTVENKGDHHFGLSGETSLCVMIPCARCLKPVRYRLALQFSYEDELKDMACIDGYSLDVDLLIHDEALLVWPEQVLCREDCKGLCSVCGHDLNEGPCGCDRRSVDPRMAKILDIFNKDKEV